jgi:hypothetical protein
VNQTRERYSKTTAQYVRSALVRSCEDWGGHIFGHSALRRNNAQFPVTM